MGGRARNTVRSAGVPLVQPSTPALDNHPVKMDKPCRGQTQRRGGSWSKQSKHPSAPGKAGSQDAWIRSWQAQSVRRNDDIQGTISVHAENPGTFRFEAPLSFHLTLSNKSHLAAARSDPGLYFGSALHRYLPLASAAQRRQNRRVRLNPPPYTP